MANNVRPMVGSRAACISWCRPKLLPRDNNHIGCRHHQCCYAVGPFARRRYSRPPRLDGAHLQWCRSLHIGSGARNLSLILRWLGSCNGPWPPVGPIRGWPPIPASLTRDYNLHHPCHSPTQTAPYLPAYEEFWMTNYMRKIGRVKITCERIYI